jgi:quercetin dioxygenase-like cupin family protein
MPPHRELNRRWLAAGLPLLGFGGLICQEEDIMRKLVLSAMLLAAAPFAAAAMDITPDSANINWGPAPPALPPGAQLAVMSGDPGASGPYVVRAKLPAGYTVPPHTHPTDENVTVLSGEFHLGTGDNLDKTKGEAVMPGGFFRVEQGMQHYAWSTEPTVIQIHGMGPFAINYVNPADDPRNMSTMSTGQTTGQK